MNSKLANFLSVALHPLLMPTLLFVLLFFLAPVPIGADYYDLNFKLILLGFIFLYTFVAPATIIYWLYRVGVLKSLKMETLQDRRIPYFFTATIYAGLAYFFYAKNALLYPMAFILASIALVIFLVAVISLWWQISAHAAGIGGTLGAVAAIMVRYHESLLFYPFLALLLIAGWLISARLYLNAHTIRQVAVGFFLGLLISICSVITFF